jgi:hypothetical protein
VHRAAVEDRRVNLCDLHSCGFQDRNIVDIRKKVRLSFSDVPICPALPMWARTPSSLEIL